MAQTARRRLKTNARSRRAGRGKFVAKRTDVTRWTRPFQPESVAHVQPHHSPPNTQRIRCASDLPQTRSPAKYEISIAGGETMALILHKRRRQVLELLMRGPVYCASPVRISDIAMALRGDNCLDIETLTYYGDDSGGGGV